MCSACEDIPAEKLAFDHPLVLQAREIEEAMDGACVPEGAWRVYLCLSDEPIVWKHYERVRAAMDASKAHFARLARDARSTRQVFACEAVS